jgi:hypothetical protein
MPAPIISTPPAPGTFSTPFPRRPAPPKPIAAPAVAAGAGLTRDAPALPADPLAAWSIYWQGIGNNLPWYLNASRSSRAGMRAIVKRRAY